MPSGNQPSSSKAALLLSSHSHSVQGGCCTQPYSGDGRPGPLRTWPSMFLPRQFCTSRPPPSFAAFLEKHRSNSWSWGYACLRPHT
eukprot:198151-Alexandrium_andersonii.AAC.1